jgi:hypothetical protein
MPFGTACQEPFKVGLAHRRRQLAQILAFFGENVEGAQLEHQLCTVSQKRSPGR